MLVAGINGLADCFLGLKGLMSPEDSIDSSGEAKNSSLDEAVVYDLEELEAYL